VFQGATFGTSLLLPDKIGQNFNFFPIEPYHIKQNRGDVFLWQ
jgi:hypothetical protein